MRNYFFYRKFFYIFVLLALFFGVRFFFFSSQAPVAQNWNSSKTVFLNENGLVFMAATATTTIADFLAEQKINLGEHDEIFPAKDSILLPGKTISIWRAQPIKITADGKTIENWTLQKTVAGALAENSIALGRLDKVTPESNTPPRTDSPIVVTRIEIEEKVIAEEIDFKTISNEDNKLGWREKKITQAGVKGAREVKYRITYKNNKEISRVVLEKTVTKEPIPQIVTQGTFVKTGKTHKGVASWYAWKGGLFAANPWLPMGSYVRVTNPNNGKSVIVQINDRGPFGNGRIIDLDKVAFAKIAPIGAGVANITMEEIIN